MNKTRSTLSKVKHTHILAVLMLALIFYIASATFPQTLEQIGDYLQKRGNTGRQAITAQVGDSYLSMLDFEGDNLLNKGAYIDMNGWFANVMGQRFMNDRVKLDNGHLALLNDKQDVAPAANSITLLCERQRERGKHFLFVIAPAQYPKYENITPAGFDDFTNQNADDLLNILSANGVPVLDLRDALYEEGISHTDAFFVTDHHWKPRTGFWAYTKIVEHFERSGVTGAFDTKLTNINEFDIEVYEDWFLGSSGKRTGRYFAGVDDFEIITPRFATNGMTVEIPEKRISKQGSFADVAYKMSENRRDFFQAIPYSAYGNGDGGYKRYTNESAPVKLRVMSVGDSLKNVPYTFLPLVFSECDELDMRYYAGDFQEYYLDYDPDIVIVMVGAASPVQPNTTYDFLG